MNLEFDKWISQYHNISMINAYQYIAFNVGPINTHIDLEIYFFEWNEIVCVFLILFLRLSKWCLRYFQCSVTCDRGHKVRSVTCIDSKGNTVVDQVCSGDKPKSAAWCRRGRCPMWTVSPWTMVGVNICYEYMTCTCTWLPNVPNVTCTCTWCPMWTVSTWTMVGVNIC